ncbi:uncharacterized protein LOC119681945 [Teleopsis dalmanni]|uniref:uncharacterized protein LOC119681945 n=1 Tax=Teleopsis dalmanni TaxID=139649 RepID=UPI0018CD0C2A|nr:uncharacterized protein LOC119681945 [Teleopsis dalmanni]
MSAKEENKPNGDTSVNSKVPAWVKAELFEDFLKQTIPDFKGIKNFKAYPALAAGENYATVVLRIEIEMELADEKTKTASYIMKVRHANLLFKDAPVQEHNIFDIEADMYLNIVPQFERMYNEAGVQIKFGAQCYKLNTKEDYVLLEDLRPRDFKNANRLEGLDLEHTKATLKKLAQWHAASAVYVETIGKYDDKYLVGHFRPDFKGMMKQVTDGMAKSFLTCMKTYAGHEEYEDSVLKVAPKMVDELFKFSKIDASEFNVLNHGDCWSNNIMSQWDAFGKIKETYLVDYQIPKYGTPAQDLLYFLLSSTKLELKLSQFEYFIKYYYDNLIENLKLLKYNKPLPQLKEIHAILYKYGLWGYTTATGVMAAVLLDPNDNADLEMFVSESNTAADFKMLMFSNGRYRKHIEAILPWLKNRGALEY